MAMPKAQYRIEKLAIKGLNKIQKRWRGLISGSNKGSIGMAMMSNVLD